MRHACGGGAVSKVENIDLSALKQRLALAVQGATGMPGSLYLHTMGAMLLASAPEASAEMGLWSSLFDLQARIEGINGGELLSALVEVGS